MDTLSTALKISDVQSLTSKLYAAADAAIKAPKMEGGAGAKKRGGALEGRTVAELIKRARALNIKDASKMNKGALIRAIRDKNKNGAGR
jgi:hypothetical protein